MTVPLAFRRWPAELGVSSSVAPEGLGLLRSPAVAPAGAGGRPRPDAALAEPHGHGEERRKRRYRHHRLTTSFLPSSVLRLRERGSAGLRGAVRAARAGGTIPRSANRWCRRPRDLILSVDVILAS
eukprot:Tamp_19990.p4 GENE.Tamp_19990~~Tamp_19990.p4  ORF type:complete len:126 (+),score=2.77 Tamp_19990:658-1035(+)